MSGMRLAGLALGTALLAALVLSGCGADATDAEPVRTNQIDLPPSYRFDPAVIEVPAGTTVTWTNKDRFTHNVKVEDGETHVLDKGASVSIAFEEPGEYDFVCTYHPKDMRGKVIVTAP